MAEETAAYPYTPTSPNKDGDASRRLSSGSLQRTPPPSQPDLKRKPIPVLQQPEVRLHGAPASPVSISPPRPGIHEPETASIRSGSGSYAEQSAQPPRVPEHRISTASFPIRSRPSSSGQIRVVGEPSHSRDSSASIVRIEHNGSPLREGEDIEEHHSTGLHYHAFDDLQQKARKQQRASQMTLQSTASSSSGGADSRPSHQLLVPGPRSSSAAGLPRPNSVFTLASEMRGRTLSPMSANGSDHGSPNMYAREPSASRRSPGTRPVSYIDLLNNVPHHQQVAPAPLMNNSGLQSVVGNAASLLNTKKTLEMYRANVKKTNDASVQYEFAVFMVNASKEPGEGMDSAELISEAKHILQRLSDRAYPFAQYYLADGYFSGLFNKEKPDFDKAFPLFVSASKHGHAEAGYRAALCYEFGWGGAKNYQKAVQFYRNSASKNHPGAATRLGLACVRGDMGLGKHAQKEGIRWLKRAQESADLQYNSAPYELGLMHLTGYGDEIFKDEEYASQLLTQAAELGHAQANFMMGQAYEDGLYSCPRDASLSVHFYNGAATRGVPEAMMALCAWYMVGAPPVLEKDEGEAYAWAKQAADLAFPKAEYAVGYFTEMGVGCRRDPLEANVWYVRAADKGNENAKMRLSIIRAAASGEPGIPMSKVEAKSKDLAGNKETKKKKLGIF